MESRVTHWSQVRILPPELTTKFGKNTRSGRFFVVSDGSDWKSRAGFEDPEFIATSLSSSEVIYEGCTVHVMEEIPAAADFALHNSRAGIDYG